MTYYTYLDTPISPILLAGEEHALSMTSFTTGWQTRNPAADWCEDAAPLEFAIVQFDEYFAGERQDFDLPLTIHGTDFQKKVWAALRGIPFGETRSYGDVANALGRPGASRAVGTANAANILPIVIPCHRVIGADGRLTGFGGGLSTKEWLLRHEGALTQAQESLFPSSRT